MGSPFRGREISIMPNMELSCAAESPARSEPQRRHPCEKEDHLRRQLKRFVMSLVFRGPTPCLQGGLTIIPPTASTEIAPDLPSRNFMKAFFLVGAKVVYPISAGGAPCSTKVGLLPGHRASYTLFPQGLPTRPHCHCSLRPS
jgi:hypothetical protein